jgi:DNA-binding CsgD family transcriptional regulator/PAS domain-containing protein
MIRAVYNFCFNWNACFSNLLFVLRVLSINQSLLSNPSSGELTMVTARAYSELLATLHSTPLDPAHWERFLQQVCTYTDSVHGFFTCSSSNVGTQVMGHGGSGDMAGAQRLYNKSYYNTDPFRLAVLQSTRLGIIDGDELVSDAELLQSPFYKKVLEPSGLRYLTIMSMSATPRRMEAVSVWRGPEQGRMDEEKREFLRCLMPHVQIALDVRQRLRNSERLAQSVQTLLDRTWSAAFLVTRQGRVLHFNQPARDVLAASVGVEIRKGRLCASERLDDAQLQALLQPQRGDRRLAKGGAMRLHRRDGSGRPLHVIATPIATSELAVETNAMMVLMTDPDAQICYSDSVLKGLYGLTHAETEVANAYLTGYTSEEVALLRGVSLSTVRSQLKVLLQKTGTRRQSDLLRLLMTLPRIGTRPLHSRSESH